MSADEEHGFLWRLNNYWSYEEGDGGLYIQVESVSLSRSVPNGPGLGDRAVCEQRAEGIAGVYVARDTGCAEEVVRGDGWREIEREGGRTMGAQILAAKSEAMSDGI